MALERRVVVRRWTWLLALKGFEDESGFAGAQVAAGGVRGRMGVRPPAGQDGPGHLDCGLGEGDVGHDPQGLSPGDRVLQPAFPGQKSLGQKFITEID